LTQVDECEPLLHRLLDKCIGCFLTLLGCAACCEFERIVSSRPLLFYFEEVCQILDLRLFEQVGLKNNVLQFCEASRRFTVNCVHDVIKEELGACKFPLVKIREMLFKVLEHVPLAEQVSGLRGEYLLDCSTHRLVEVCHDRLRL